MTRATVYGSRNGRTRIATRTASPSSPTSSSRTCGISSSMPDVTGAGGRSPAGLGLSDVDALEEAEPSCHAHQRGAAVGDERERDAGDRHDPEHHADVHDELEEDHRGDPGGEQRAECVTGPPTGDEGPPEQEHEQNENRDSADEPELFGEGREHEVSRLDRKEVTLRL